ncbi:4a-hydroxytetrahydrobiopterin dehydratase [Rhizobium paknamense]|uniref:Putative pterin-4-alpha-carbinolamine dehydratase n=1 Tax=Rhizobium paknamense TaxID=1206817 RepID=A0ABU0IGQ1_9HYPH|nr:4a-hydroxytetrahydrobiopterin dehydratase [Rhizobium paknamense]MDQ0457346.1 4a-hydroxytetrahydrobiopterin dehydratase [Rhizobium paknamense]
MRDQKLAAENVRERMGTLTEWELSDDGLSIRRDFAFRDFAEAFGFMAECAVVAEKLNHHPEWFNVYRRVEVCLTTHDSGGLTARDFDLGLAMDRIAARRV